MERATGRGRKKVGRGQEGKSERGKERKGQKKESRIEERRREKEQGRRKKNHGHDRKSQRRAFLKREFWSWVGLCRLEKPTEYAWCHVLYIHDTHKATFSLLTLRAEHKAHLFPPQHLPLKRRSLYWESSHSSVRLVSCVVKKANFQKWKNSFPLKVTIVSKLRVRKKWQS